MSNPAYKDPAQPLETRISDLLGRMTLEEKVGQLMQLDMRNEPEKQLRAMQPGSFLHGMGDAAKQLQRIACTETRLGIPLIFGIDAIHGHAFWNDGTVFPTQLSLGCSWNAGLAERVARATAREVAATGVHWTFSPVLCVARDMRWGRVDETFGEDPLLIGDLALAMIRGYEGEDLAADDTIAACAKHFAAYSETRGGLDSSEAELSRRKLWQTFLPAFERAARSGCATFMVGYQAIDGVPCSASRWLLTEVLRDAWDYDGMVVTDWNNIGNLEGRQHVAADMNEAARIGLHAGNDMIMSTPPFYQAAIDGVKDGTIAQEELDQAVTRVLGLKFRLGLFDRPWDHQPLEPAAVGCCEEHLAVSLDASRQTVVLLKNEGTLPVRPEVKRIAVIGPCAANVGAQLGDWSMGSGQAGFEIASHGPEKVITLLEGLRRRAAQDDVEIIYAPGCSVRDDTDDAFEDIPAAVAAAEQADLVVLAVGDDLSLAGEFGSRVDLALTGRQDDLIAAVLETGTPTAVVVVASKPTIINDAARRARAVLTAFNSGMHGGQAMAEAIFGDINPAGRLSVSWPRHVGQTPITYDDFPGAHVGVPAWPDCPAGPLYPFGHGLSYTTFRYGEPQLAADVLHRGEDLSLAVEVTNTGERDGTEVLQVYVRDVVASVTRPDKRLAAYARVDIPAGETRRVELTVPFDALAVVDAEANRVVEPGEFHALVGPSSDNDDLQTVSFQVAR
jgi:beta-glucosidase